MSPAIATAKAQWRSVLQARRSGLDPAGAGAALAAHCPAALLGLTPVSFYWPWRGEIDPRPLAQKLADAGAELALPRLAARDGALCFQRWQAGDGLAPDAFGILSPLADAPVLEPRVLLVPLLGFDRAGRRLGYGRGHYDRALQALQPKGALAVGLAFAEQEVEEVPCEAHDQRLDWVVTPKGAFAPAMSDKTNGRG
jgi:5-formyltetrahydrofolate cyclo-ligase